MTDYTRSAIHCLERKNIPFILVSARSPSGIYPILKKNSFSCPIISYSGALICDKNKNLIYQKGMDISTASNIIEYIKEQKFDLTWNLFSFDDWISQSKNDPRIQEEERIVEAESCEGDISSIQKYNVVHKILCMCNPDEINIIESKISKKFPECMVVKSSPKLLEIMTAGINKAESVKYLCDQWNINLKDVIAFGDNYNDCEMLETVGHGIVMGNSPEDIKKRFSEITLDNNNDGIPYALRKYHIID